MMEGMSDQSRLRRTARSAVRASYSGVRRTVRAPVTRRLAMAGAIFVVSLVGVLIGVALGAHTDTDIGPFRAEMSLSPSARGDTELVVPPLGALHVDSHEGPAHLKIQLGSLDQGRTEAIVADPNGIVRASETAVEDVEQGVTRLVLRTLGATVLSSLLLSALVFRNARRVAWSGGLALLVTMAALGTAVATFRPDSIEEPRYEGLLVNAPAVVGDARRIANRYEEYRAQLQRLVRNVSRLYTTVSTLPVFEPDPSSVRVLHVSDLHLNPSAWSVIQTVVEQFDIDVVIDTGDITDWGSEPEASYVAAIRRLGVPYVYVRGNHDSARTAASVAAQPNAVVLDNQVATVAGLTIAGIGDPRFTPDKVTSPTGSGSSRQTVERVIEAGETLADTIRASGKPVDIALVHDPASAAGLSSVSPLVLAGHRHQREVSELAPGTTLMVEGSTGGAGLRGLESEAPVPLALSVLYFSARDRKLAGYDDISVGGAGLANFTLERHVVREPEPTPTPATRPTR